ncbi:MAG: transposase [Gammaproteobacteria bacterium]|nr:transposase [Gammaproteobacteria bacterium]
MTRPRKELVSVADTPYYHCVCRCVRRAFLWGRDRYSRKDYSHRKQWVVERLATLSDIFAIDLCAYAVMSNHYHVVIRIDDERAKDWTEKEVIDRWSRLFGVPVLVARYESGETRTEAEQNKAREIISIWRERLADLSWYMRSLNEHLARLANAEDHCKGRFWEGRFKSQALLDEAGLLTCMAYVDLNPIRAGIAQRPETSEFTSICQRIQTLSVHPRRLSNNSKHKNKRQSQFPALASFCARSNAPANAIPFTLKDYLELVDWTGRAVREDKRGHIPAHIPPILTRLNVNPKHWLTHMQPNGDQFNRVVGRVEGIKDYAERVGQRWLCGLKVSQQMFSSSRQ